jgi:uncharacterized protein (TIGR03382 family)
MRAVPLLLLVACDPATVPPPSGTSVGNPGKNLFRAAPGEGLVYDAAVARGLSFELVACDGTAEVVAPAGELDLLADEQTEFTGLEWCAVVVTADEIQVTGGPAEGDGLDFDLTLALPTPTTLWTSAPFAVDGESFVLELGAPGWITAEGLGIGAEPVVIGPESEGHDRLLVPLIAGTAWYLDEDEDGEVSAAERSAGPVAATANPPPPEMAAPEDTAAPPASVGLDGCNCASAPGPGALPLLLPLLVALRRARRTFR